MVHLLALPGAAELIHHLVVIERKTHEKTSRELQRVYLGVSSGLSTKSTRRFCASEGIHRTSRLTSNQLNRVVLGCVQTIGEQFIGLSS